MTGTSDSTLRIRLYLPNGTILGPGKADLLALISETGSIAAAGRALGMSYRRAWGLVEAMNAMFREPVVESSRGGAGHGGATVTAMGEHVLTLYRALESKAAQAAGTEIDHIEGLLAFPDSDTIRGRSDMSPKK
ncbi:MAG: winged helix-turn-helix domain-containing protein [Hyphomicrobiaceae bacterium]